MEIRSVEYFLTVVDHASFRAAAHHLGLTQPAVTKAIRRLEDEMGVTLFKREPRGVSLTIAGEAFLRHAANLRANLRDAGAEMAALGAGSSGRVRVGAGPAWEHSVVPEAIISLRQQRPGIQVQVVGGSDEQLKILLRAGRLDFVAAAISEPPSLEADLDGRPLLFDDYLVVAASNHPLRSIEPVDAGQLLEFPWVLPSPGTYMADRIQMMFRTQGLPPPSAAVETDIRSLKFRLLRGTDYLGFHTAGELCDLKPERLGPLEVAGMTWRRLAGIITRNGSNRSPAALALMDAIETVCAGLERHI